MFRLIVHLNESSMKMNMSVERWENDSDRRQRGVIGGRPVQMPFCTTQISHRLAWVEPGPPW
jgi:hypothetical protein